MLVVTTRAVLVALIAMGMLAGCGRAVSKPEEPEPTPMEPPGPTAAELIEGTWRRVESLVGKQSAVRHPLFHHDVYEVTLCHRQRRRADQRNSARRLDKARNVVRFETTETQIAMTVLDTSPLIEGQDDNHPGVPRNFHVRYFWPNTERTTIIVQEWDFMRVETGGEAVRLKPEYTSYTRVTEPLTTEGSWEFQRSGDDERFTLTVTADSLLWQHHPRPGMSYDTHGRITSIDAGELFVISRCWTTWAPRRGTGGLLSFRGTALT